MNRAQRRALRPHKPNREALNRHPAMLVRSQQFFKPLDDMLDDIERSGTVDAVQGNPVVSLDADTTMTFADQALDQTAAWIGSWCRANRRAVDTGPLTRLAAKLRNSMPLTPQDVTDARSALQRMRLMVVSMTEAERVSMDLGRMIEDEMEAI